MTNSLRSYITAVHPLCTLINDIISYEFRYNYGKKKGSEIRRILF